MRPPCIKSRDRISFFICPKRELCFIPVAERIFHSDDRFHDPVNKLRCEAADTFQIPPDFLLFEYKLSVIGHRLDLTASALTRKSAPRFHTVR